jgi:hypothetical protein
LGLANRLLRDGYHSARRNDDTRSFGIVFHKDHYVKEMVAGMTDSNVADVPSAFSSSADASSNPALQKTIGNQIAKIMKTEMMLIVGL